MFHLYRQDETLRSIVFVWTVIFKFDTTIQRRIHFTGDNHYRCPIHYKCLIMIVVGVLSADGRSKVFDADADGYARSEAIVVIFLQKAKDAKRIYATVVHGKTNCDGFKEQGITFPSSRMQSELLRECYEDCGVPPNILSYLECHGTGTKVGDPEEVNAIDKICTKDRATPLLIGSIKSNLGHSEPASGVCQVAKVAFFFFREDDLLLQLLSCTPLNMFAATALHADSHARSLLLFYVHLNKLSLPFTLLLKEQK